jgi:hypothetical protein
MRIRAAAADVMRQRVLRRGETAVVHVRAAVGQVAQRGRLETTHIVFVLGDRVTPYILQVAARIGADAQVVELVVGEERGIVIERVARNQARRLTEVGRLYLASGGSQQKNSLHYTQRPSQGETSTSCFGS